VTGIPFRHGQAIQQANQEAQAGCPPETAAASKEGRRGSFLTSIQTLSVSPDCRHLVVDGHSVLFSLPQLAAPHAPASRAARRALIHALQRFQDFSGIGVSVAFDGRGGAGEFRAPGTLEIRYAGSHQTADAIIEKSVASHPRPSELVVVSGDIQERTTVEALGAKTLSPEGLLDWMRDACPPGPPEGPRTPAHGTKKIAVDTLRTTPLNT